MDTVDKSTRSRIMSRVGQRDTGAEMFLRRALHRRGFRYRLYDRKLPGTPDMIFPRFHAVVFVHGCFWHAHGCKFSTMPSTRSEFWAKKFEENRKRDRLNIDSLLADGWRVLVIWECAVKRRRTLDPDEVISSVVDWLNSDDQWGEISEGT
jgi:DNA mismatch endonuclease, patch repair protein